MGDSSEKTGRLAIPDWSIQDRPREKFASLGANALSDAELVAILLRTGTPTESAVDLAKRVLSFSDNHLNSLAEKSLSQLTNIKGIGNTKAITLLAAFEMAKRLSSERVAVAQHIHSSQDVVDVMQDKLAHLRHEEFWVIYLNQGSKILNINQISKGGLTTTVADVRLIVQKAIMLNATRMIVCHNHPSGNLVPSKQDCQLTKQIKEATRIFNIELTDHVILYRGKHFSFMEEGIL